MLLPGNLYTRKEIWPYYQPEKEYPAGGDWFTGYTTIDEKIIAFANIGSPGRTGHDFPNDYDPIKGQMTWYGKPNSHSAQPTFKRILSGINTIDMFVRWDSTNTRWYFLGRPEKIIAFEDGVKTEGGDTTIKLTLSFDCNQTTDEVLSENNEVKGTEGQRIGVLVNRYERDPRLRSEAIRIHGTICVVCSFDFEQSYGKLGKDFCHIHHLTPLSENEGEVSINPKEDLVPVCPNCHAMLHKRKPALTPQELKQILQKKHN